MMRSANVNRRVPGLALVVWSDRGYSLMSFWGCLSIWQSDRVYSISDKTSLWTSKNEEHWVRGGSNLCTDASPCSLHFLFNQSAVRKKKQKQKNPHCLPSAHHSVLCSHKPWNLQHFLRITHDASCQLQLCRQALSSSHISMGSLSIKFPHVKPSSADTCSKLLRIRTQAEGSGSTEHPQLWSVRVKSSTLETAVHSLKHIFPQYGRKDSVLGGLLENCGIKEGSLRNSSTLKCSESIISGPRKSSAFRSWIWIIELDLGTRQENLASQHFLSLSIKTDNASQWG